MLRILLTVIAAALVTVFAVDNMHRVEVGLVVGRPAHVRLFFLLLTAAVIPEQKKTASLAYVPLTPY